MRLFLDTSALAKRYVAEAGSDRVDHLLARAERLGVSVLVLPELLSTLSRLVRERRLTRVDYASLKQKVTFDLNDADVCDLTPAILERTVECLERYSLRTLDAVHLGSALVFAPDLFASADRHQIDAARKAGLAVEAVGIAKG